MNCLDWAAVCWPHCFHSYLRHILRYFYTEWVAEWTSPPHLWTRTGSLLTGWTSIPWLHLSLCRRYWWSASLCVGPAQQQHTEHQLRLNIMTVLTQREGKQVSVAEDWNSSEAKQSMLRKRLYLMLWKNEEGWMSETSQRDAAWLNHQNISLPTSWPALNK